MKIIASFCGFLICAVFGYINAVRIEDRCDMLSGFVNDIKQLGLQLEFTMQPVFVLIDNMKAVHMPKLWDDIKKHLRDGTSIHEAWSMTKEQEKSTLLSVLKADEISVLDDFFATLGTSDIETQKKNLSNINQRIERLQSSLAAESAAKIKVYKSVGILSGIAVFILLL